MAATHASSGTRGPSPLKGANALILDEKPATASALRSQLEDRGAAYVEIAETADEALDVLGRAARPVKLAMLDTTTDGGACAEVLAVLRRHRARVHVTLHGRWPPDPRAAPRHLAGAAAFILQITPPVLADTVETVIDRGLTVGHVIDDRIVPETLEAGIAIAIYGAGPGRPFPATVRI